LGLTPEQIDNGFITASTLWHFLNPIIY
jgi:hypothetical protein